MRRLFWLALFVAVVAGSAAAPQAQATPLIPSAAATAILPSDGLVTEARWYRWRRPYVRWHRPYWRPYWGWRRHYWVRRPYWRRHWRYR